MAAETFQGLGPDWPKSREGGANLLAGPLRRRRLAELAGPPDPELAHARGHAGHRPLCHRARSQGSRSSAGPARIPREVLATGKLRRAVRNGEIV